MLPPRIAALAIVALVIAAMTALIVVAGTGALDTGGGQRGVGDTTTSRPVASTSRSVASTSRSTPTSAATAAPASAPTSVASSRPPARPIPSATPTPTRTATSTPTPPSLEPNTVAIPAQGVRAPIGDCAVVDRALLPPSDLGRTCRWVGGADRDARSGTTVLVGEAQWADRGPAAFGRIGQLAAGERIVTYDGRGTAAR